MSLGVNQQSFHSINVAAAPPYPLAPWQDDPTETTQYSVTFDSVSEAHVGQSGQDRRCSGPHACRDALRSGEVGPNPHKDVLAKSPSGTPYLLCFTGSPTSCGIGTG